jgi:hypothetical protein
MMILKGQRDSEDREVHSFRARNQVSFERLDLLGEPCLIRSVFWDADRLMKGNHGCLPKLLRLVRTADTRFFMLIKRLAAVATETFVVPDSGAAGRTALGEWGPTVFAEPSVRPVWCTARAALDGHRSNLAQVRGLIPPCIVICNARVLRREAAAGHPRCVVATCFS